MQIQWISVITCPNCGEKSSEKMEADACRYFFVCPHCQFRMKPKKGDCCVFCSYGDVPCPPIQKQAGN